MNAVISMVLRICGLVVAASTVIYMATVVVGPSSWASGFVFDVVEVVVIAGTIVFMVNTANATLMWSIERRKKKAEKV